MKHQISHIAFVFLFAMGCSVGYCQNSVATSKVADSAKTLNKKYPVSSTSKRISVDSHGRALDTDKDGVPDYKDKELLTHQSCLPVDSNGVGVCPDPLCCREFNRGIIDPFPDCEFGYKEVHFAPRSKALSATAKKLLDTIGNQLKRSPTCKIKVGTYGGMTKRSMQLSWERINVVCRFLVEKKSIVEERILFVLDLGDEGIVGLEIGEPEGPNIIPAPHPRYRN